MGEWQNGLFGCFNNCGLCIITYILPCYTFGKNAEALGGNCTNSALLLLVPIANLYFMVKQRTAIRERQGIDGSGGSDCACVLFCPLLSLVQQAQECQSFAGGMAVDIERQ